jgi:hypothetical protein
MFVSTDYKSRDFVVGIATGYRLDDQGIGVRVLVGARIFISPRHPDRLWGPPNLSNGYWGLKKIWIYTSTPPYAFMA